MDEADDIERLMQAKRRDPPDPWRPHPCSRLEGIIAVGFGAARDAMLVHTWDGLHIVDLTRAQTVREEIVDADLVEQQFEGLEFGLRCRGFGPLEGETISLAGTFGGGLPLITEDGWSLQRYATGMNRERIVLYSPEHPSSEGPFPPGATLLFDWDSSWNRAYGFSWCGSALVVAAGPGLALWVRDRGD